MLAAQVVGIKRREERNFVHGPFSSTSARPSRTFGKRFQDAKRVALKRQAARK
jgi:hypothetical protein